MSESDWAVSELTDEEEAEMQAEQENASEEEPVQVHLKDEEGEENLLVTDQRPPSERYAGDEKEDIEATTSEESKPESEVKSDTSETTEEKPEPDWWDKMSPEDQRKHALGLQSEVSKIRETRRDERDENERRIQKMMEDKFSEFKSQNAPDPVIPDREYDPDEYMDRQDARLKEYEAADAQRREVDTEQSEQQVGFDKLNKFVMDQEDLFAQNNTDYFDAIKWGRAERAKRHMGEYGIDEAAAISLTNREINDAAVNVRDLGGNAALVFYNEAKKMGWGKESNANGAEPKTKSTGEDTAAAITAGEKAAKGLGKGGSGSTVGELTPESISHLTGDEFDKALEEWENKIIGEQGNWTP